jgi:hypothetical protein
VFVDETKERGYLIAGAIVYPEKLATSRRLIRSLILPRQRRIHFNGESNPRRHKVLDAIVESGIRAVIYDAGTYRPSNRARDACLVRLLEDLEQWGAARLILERDDSVVRSDQTLLYARTRLTSFGERFEYGHLRAHEEWLLSIADAVAWCWVRGGQWRARVEGVVADVRRV